MLVVYSSFPSGKVLRSSWHLFLLAFTQCGRTGRNAMPGQMLPW